MPKRDIMGETVQRVTKTIGSLRSDMQMAMPTGPKRAQYTAKEARVQIQNLDPIAKAALIRRVGEEKWDKMLDKIYG